MTNETKKEIRYFSMFTGVGGFELGTEYCRSKVSVFSDSELVINQLNGTYAIKVKELRDLFKQIKINEQFYQEVVYNWVSRNNPNIKKAELPF